MQGISATNDNLSAKPMITRRAPLAAHSVQTGSGSQKGNISSRSLTRPKYGRLALHGLKEGLPNL